MHRCCVLRARVALATRHVDSEGNGSEGIKKALSELMFSYVRTAIAICSVVVPFFVAQDQRDTTFKPRNPRADLAVVSLTHSPAGPTAGSPITFTATIKNVGLGRAKPSVLAFRVGSETPPGQTFAVPALDPGDSYSVSRHEVLVPQRYRNTVVADVNNDVQEVDETNNERADEYTVWDPTGWLRTKGRYIYTSAGVPWRVRGANLPDTRSCDRCTFNAPNRAEVVRRADELITNWHVTFLRLDLESYAAADGRTQWANVLVDPQYLDDIVFIVGQITQRNVYVLLSLQTDPSFDSLGRPTVRTQDEWRALAGRFLNNPRVLFGIVNEPEKNDYGADDLIVRDAMLGVVQAIRSVENDAGTPHHVIAVQGPGGWARRIKAYLKPEMRVFGDNIVYEVHVYNPAAEFEDLWKSTARKLPVIIGEFAPVPRGNPAGLRMSLQDCLQLMKDAEAMEIPYLGWVFHMQCPPNLLEDTAPRQCGVGMTFVPTAWGKLLKERLQQPY